VNKNNILVFIFCIFAVIICGVLFYINTAKEENIGSVVFSYTDDSNIISIDNSLPISDKVGKLLNFSDSDDKVNSYFEFTVDCNLTKNISYDYEIYATKEVNVNEISDSYIKIYLTDGSTDKPLSLYNKPSVPTFSEFEDSKINSNSKVLYTGKCNSNTSKKYILRMWLSDTYTINFNKRMFSIKVNVKTIY